MKIFDVQRGSYHDGPGLRTVVFLKGCSLTCKWCQNPESHSFHPQILQYEELCIGCGACRKTCPSESISLKNEKIHIDREKCKGCGKCAQVCYAGALCISGRSAAPEELAEEILCDKPFFDVSGGGVTLSGGEPLMQYEECERLLKLLKTRGIHTALETCGQVEYKAFEAILPCLDHIYYDVKLIDSDQHEKYCGAGNEKILDNLKRLGEEGIPITVRTPIIPGVNDTDEFIKELGEFLSDIRGIKQAELLPFHSLCKNKYRALGKEFVYEKVKSPENSRMTELRKKLMGYGVAVKGGKVC